MKILVIGIGNCGGRIADEFHRLNGQARRKRGLEIVSGAFAVNTDAGDLIGLSSIRADYRRRVLIGVDETGGKGVAGSSELGAKIAQEHADAIVESIKEVERFYETDALLLVAATAGGTGSGAIPVLTQRCKQRYPEKGVYAMLVLPFENEEKEEARTIINTGVCLKSVDSVADAIFLVDNQSYVSDAPAAGENLDVINRKIVEPFYNLLCAGEEKRKKYIGGKLLDAGDIIQTLEGWTILGSSRLTLSRLPALAGGFMKKSSETHRGIKVMDEAIGELYVRCNPRDAGKALYLISAPVEIINLELIKELGDYLKSAVPNAVIRSGDYPVERGAIEVTILLSQLSDVERVREIYLKSSGAAGTPKADAPDAGLPEKDTPEKDNGTSNK